MDLLKKLDNMITAEEFLRKSSVTSSDKHDFLSKQELMIEFAKLHVEASLKEASEKVKTFDIYNESCGDVECKVTLIDKKSILTAYSLDNIK